MTVFPQPKAPGTATVPPKTEGKIVSTTLRPKNKYYNFQEIIKYLKNVGFPFDYYSFSCLSHFKNVNHLTRLWM